MPAPTPAIQILSVPGLPLIRPGDDLPALIADALIAAEITLQAGDVLVVTSKIVSKAEGRIVDLRRVSPSAFAVELATRTGKDPRLVELIMSEARGISRQRGPVLITRHKLGFVSANSGIDQSNVRGENDGQHDDFALLLPENPDESARQLRAGMVERCGVAPAIVISDTHGRPHRLGNVGVAVGVAGIPAVLDLRGRPDLFNRRLQHTDIGLADELAAAADLLSGQAAEGRPVTLIRGVPLPPDAAEGRASDLYRPVEMDLYG